MTGPVTLAPEAVEAVARRVVELLAEQRTPTGDRLVDAAELAGLLGVERGWVYDNAEHLGAIRLGDGGRPRLRFNVERALAAWQHHGGRTEPKSEQTTPRRRHRPASSGSLLPIRGRAA